MRIRDIFVLMMAICLISCTVTKPVKTGEMAYEYKQYALAVKLLEKEYNESSNAEDQARKARYLAKSYDILEQYGEALPWYDVADQLYQNERSSNELAYSLKVNERYADAVPIFDRLYKQSNDIKYRRESQLCTIAAKEIENVDNYKLESMQFNTRNSEYSPVFFEDDFLLFSSDREGGTGSKAYKWNDRSFSDLWVTDFKGRQVYNFDALINSENNEGTVCFSKDYQEIFFTRCFSTDTRDQYCKLYYSQRPNGFWLEPEALMFFDDQTNFAHPCLIENDSVLIFTAKAGGSDNYDLYYSVRIGQAWSEAEIMPSSINTEGDEKFPTSHGDSLFFASDGHLGYGGLDIYMTELNDDGSWTEPVNMAWPINSGSDDFGLIIRDDDRQASIELQGLFSSSRNTGYSTDIFSFTRFKIEEEKEEIIADIEEEEQLNEKTYLAYLSVKLLENIREDDDPNKKVIETRALNEGIIELRFDTDSLDLEPDDNGFVLYKLDSDSKHMIQAKSKDHLSKRLEIDIPSFYQLSSDTTINIEIVLEKIVYEKEIIISNIYYDYDKWDIREDAQSPLDSLSELLIINPQIRIELASHTDCRGEDDYNLDLSQKRAQAVVDYLIDKGLDADRFTAVGYGEGSLTINCECTECTEEEHQANRRTSFKILKPE